MHEERENLNIQHIYSFHAKMLVIIRRGEQGKSRGDLAPGGLAPVVESRGNMHVQGDVIHSEGADACRKSQVYHGMQLR